MVEGLAQLDQIMLTVLGLRFWVASSQKSCFFFFLNASCDGMTRHMF